MACRQRLEAYLTDHGVRHHLDTHRPAFTAQAVAEADHISGRMLAKVVMVMSCGQLQMFVLPAPSYVDLQRIRDILCDASARLATEPEFGPRFPDCERGAMPAFGNLYGIPVHVDRSLTQTPRLAMQAGTHEDLLVLDYKDFERLVHPRVESFSVIDDRLTV